MSTGRWHLGLEEAYSCRRLSPNLGRPFRSSVCWQRQRLAAQKAFSRHKLQASTVCAASAGTTSLGEHVLETEEWQIIKVSGPEARSMLMQAADVVSKAFSMKYRRQNPFDVLSNTKYVSEMFLKIWYRYETKQGQHVTLVARPTAGAPETRVAGAVEVTVAEADEALAELLGCPKGGLYAVVDNMAVAPEHRKKGLGRLLLSACEALAPELRLSPPGFVALYVYKSNFPAISLYEGAGYSVVEGWIDPEWATAAERGQIGKAKKLLMLKKLA